MMALADCFFVAICAVLGACLASFADAVAQRTVAGVSWWGMERSRCDSCGKELSAVSLIPVVSFLIQRGRCRDCGEPIPRRHIVTEAVGAVVGGALAARLGLTFEFAVSMTAAFFLMLNALTDYESGYIYDMFSLSMAAVGLLTRLPLGASSIADGLLGAACGFGLFAAVMILSRGGMGLGDAFFAGGMGAFLGWQLELLAVYVGLMAGGVGAVVLLIMKKVKFGRGDKIPLAPYLAVGGIVALSFGSDILRYIKTNYMYFSR